MPDLPSSQIEHQGVERRGQAEHQGVERRGQAQH